MNAGALRLRCLGSSMPERHMTDLMRHNPGHFAFGTRRLDHSTINKHRSAGQCEGIDIARVDNTEGVPEFRMLKFGRDCCSKRSPNPLHVGICISILRKERQFPRNLSGCLSSYLNVVGWLVAVLWWCNPRSLTNNHCRTKH